MDTDPSTSTTRLAQHCKGQGCEGEVVGTDAVGPNSAVGRSGKAVWRGVRRAGVSCFGPMNSITTCSLAVGMIQHRHGNSMITQVGTRGKDVKGEGV